MREPAELAVSNVSRRAAVPYGDGTTWGRAAQRLRKEGFKIRIHGRGRPMRGDCGRTLSAAAFGGRKKAHAFPSFGSERTRALAVSFCRFDDKPITVREPVMHPDVLIRRCCTRSTSSKGRIARLAAEQPMNRELTKLLDKNPRRPVRRPVLTSSRQQLARSGRERAR